MQMAVFFALCVVHSIMMGSLTKMALAAFGVYVGFWAAWATWTIIINVALAIGGFGHQVQVQVQDQDKGQRHE